MASFMSLKQPEWNLSRSVYEEVEYFPLMSNPGPVFMILAVYLAFILKIGPEIMRKRDGFKLKGVLAVYNAFQVLLSFYLVISITSLLLESGFFPRTCCMNNNRLKQKILRNTWLYFAAKVSELADTVLFVLRKKDNQVTFLHVYHHSIMMIGTWATLKYSPTESIMYIGFINSIVHVFMYTYYGLSAYGPRFAKYLTWKKYLTSFQLIQFVSIIIHFFIARRTSECPPSAGYSLFIASNVVAFFGMFANFYIQSYLNSGRRKTSKGQLINDTTDSTTKKIN